ncbi:TIM-barrel domain-containing protein [Phytoactinopolyspora limicola]|uniref:TIM-barrel domain-containing protein n=1 Tax=Phytoactinopolyspora limicola TaxID=2715536 RepID=UPI001A9C7E1D|nr:TIM-barrel domain-containing protein [Phytoactinopolyspora limicola]
MRASRPMSLLALPVAGVLLAATLLPSTVTDAAAQPAAQAAGVERVEFSSGSSYLIVEVLDDDLVHFEVSGVSPSPGTSSPLFTTEQVAATGYPGPSSFSQDGSTLATADLRVEVDSSTLCSTVTDTTRTPEVVLHTVCPVDLTHGWKGLDITKEGMENAYGLGQQFFTGGSADGDWVGRIRTPGGQYGNAMVYDPDNGPVGNTQIPVLFAIGPDRTGYGFFLDHVYKTEWDLAGDPWTVRTWGDEIRWYTMAGPDLPDLRQDYMELTGHPPVPPKKALGLWVSEFGYESWDEVDDRLDTLRTEEFPVDGFVLDLDWFGGVQPGSDHTAMGSMSWDTSAFPDPAGRIASYEDDDGVGIMTIEESYIGRALAEHADLASRGYLVRDGCSTCDPVYLTHNDWWGRGGMIDWTQDDAGDYWHQSKRAPLIDDGVLGHWLDLGEPEMYSPSDWTAGVLPGKHAHADYHNMYNLKWAESIARGYAEAQETRRPFLLSRSGAAGLQRFGTAMWSADIGSKLTALAAQQNTQMHMSMSGIDYYGSDIGGFRREMLDSDLDEMYTQWFANGSWFEVPVRPHAENLCNCEATSPAEIGDVASNLANIRQRYELTPYYYSLAHRAHRYGEPVVPPLVYYHQDDPVVREMGHQKMVGQDLLVGVVAGAGERQRDVYLPEGSWVNYHTNEWFHSDGEWIEDVPLSVNGDFRLPAFARAGALIPRMYVDEQTMNVDGRRRDDSTRDELIVRVYADEAASSFTLYEDDGATVAYHDGAVRTTQLAQQLAGSTATVTVAGASGTFDGAAGSRDSVVELVVEDTQASAVTMNGTPLTRYATKADFDAAPSGWYNAGGNLVVAKSGSLSVATAKSFQFTLGEQPVSLDFVCEGGQTTPGQSVYVVGNIPQLGEWSAASAVKLEPTSYPTWTGTVGQLPPTTTVEWKCIKRQEANYPDTVDEWQPGANNVAITPAAGGGGTTTGQF